jgi:hypothetical protein
VIAPRETVAGKVVFQTKINFNMVYQFTLLKPFDVPVPAMDIEVIWVVLTGKPKKVAPEMTRAELKSAIKPLAGSILVIFLLTVLIILQPPAAVPKAKTTATTILTSQGVCREC